MTNDHQLLKARQVAERLQVSIGWVLDHAGGRHKPVLPSVKMGKVVRFRTEDIDAFIEHCNRYMAAGKPIP